MEKWIFRNQLRKKLLESLKIKMHIVKDKKYWSGYKCLLIGNKETLRSFDGIGFLPGVKVTRKSKKFNGIEKNMLLKLTLCNNKFKSWKDIYSWVQKPMGS